MGMDQDRSYKHAVTSQSRFDLHRDIYSVYMLHERGPRSTILSCNHYKPDQFLTMSGQDMWAGWWRSLGCASPHPEGIPSWCTGTDTVGEFPRVEEVMGSPQLRDSWGPVHRLSPHGCMKVVILICYLAIWNHLSHFFVTFQAIWWKRSHSLYHLLSLIPGNRKSSWF